MNPIDKRKFPRISVSSTSPDLQRLLGVTVRWPDGERSDVLDMSYGGAALSRPPGLKVMPKESVDLEFHIEGQAQAQVTASVVRVGDHVVAVQFGQLSSQARLSFERFMQEKLLGLSLKLVNPHYYGAKEDFTYWFHGPNDTNIFLWVNKKHLEKALIELGGKALAYEGGVFSEGESSEQGGRKSAHLNQANIQGMSPLMGHVLELVSQVQDGRELLAPLIEMLTERARRG